MPFSFTQIEKDKTNNIGLVFFFLIFFYFIVALLLYTSSKLFFIYETTSRYHGLGIDFAHFLSLKEIEATLLIAFIVGVFHFFISVINIIQKVLVVIGAQPLNPSDSYHIKFQNILDEISVATGGKEVKGVVISTMALNAFALADFSGNAVIGVTEGLLNRLNRSQLESVVAHEMAHILTGDCLETTVVTSMFSLYGDLMSGIRSSFDESRNNRNLSFLFLIYILLEITMFIANLMKMFVSREREYRADAIAVRLTRDPLSLAQALYLISKRWRGAGVHGDQMGSIFIISPQYDELEEHEGYISNLFSTHPPVAKRIDILLNMARLDRTSLEDLDKQVIPQEPVPEIGNNIQLPSMASASQWEVYADGQWRGPYEINQLMTQAWVEYDAFIRQAGTDKVQRLFETKDIKDFNQRMSHQMGNILCPICQIGLSEDLYKGAPLLRCAQCSGLLLVENDVTKIIARDDYYFSDEIHALGDALLEQQNKMQIKSIDLKTANLLTCPRCPDPKPPMLRSFYTLAYPLEIDRCGICQSIWFDKKELEILQYLIGKNRLIK